MSLSLSMAMGQDGEISGVHVHNKEELRGIRNLSFVATSV